MSLQDELELVAGGYDQGGDWDWQYFGLFRSKDGRLYTYSDGGCSCNGPFEGGDEMFEPVDNVHTALQQANSYWGSESAEAIAFAREALEI